MFEKYCLPAKIGGGLALLMLVIDIIITRFDTFTFISDFISIFIIMFVTDYFCITDRRTSAWIIAICLLILIVFYLYLYYIKDPIIMKEIDDMQKARKASETFVF